MTPAMRRFPRLKACLRRALKPLARRGVWGGGVLGAGVLGLCLLAGSVVSNGSAEAQSSRGAAACRSFAAVDPKISLDLKPGRIVYSNGHSRRQLESFRRSGGARDLTPGWFTIGLTRRGLKRETRVQVEGLRIRPGVVCVRLTEVHLILSYDRIDVYVDRKYRPGTCEYQAVLDHELEHVTNFTNAIDRYIPVLRDRLIQDASGLAPVQASGVQRGARIFQRQLAGRLEPLFDQMNQEMDEADTILDQPASYRATQQRCSNW